MTPGDEQKSQAELELEKALKELLEGSVFKENKKTEASATSEEAKVKETLKTAPSPKPVPKPEPVKNQPQPNIQAGPLPMSTREIKQLIDALRKQVREDQVIKVNMKKRIDDLTKDVEVRNEFISKAKVNLQTLTSKVQELEKTKNDFAQKFDNAKKEIEAKAIAALTDKNKTIEDLNKKLAQLDTDKTKEISDSLEQTKKNYEEKLTNAAKKVNEVVEATRKEFENKMKAILSEKEQAVDKAKELEASYNEVRDAYRQTVDDTRSYKERLAKELSEKNKYASQSLVEDLLMSLDQFDLIVSANVEDEKLSNYLQGFRIINKSIFRTLANYGLSEIETTAGMIFDPNIHEAKEAVSNKELEADEIVKVVKKGYTFKDKLVRPVLVVVNKK